jgi:hypothetical protein
MYALSLKQPWAALLVHGRKTIEVRRWPTVRRGRILIHAARISDERPEAWKHVATDLMQSAQLLGGIIGEADLTGCLAYRSTELFSRDQEHHLNEPEWFDGPIMYGFTFASAATLPFRKYPGWMRFFAVEEARQKRSK